MRILNLFIKRIVDFFGSLIGVIIISPILILIAMSIKLTSKGPVFFKQERLGKNGMVFKIFKFRTMVVNAENLGSGLFVKTEKDNRITKVGKLLRATSLDELPQLLNVLIGEMSLVGPRPPVPHHPYKHEDYNDFQRKRFEMKPGMTGLTQVTVRNSVSWDERIPIDVEYIERFNIWLDVKILFMTILKIFKRESIYTHYNIKNSKKSSSIK
ncbi:sugar transferase [Psychrobacillus lasiicapitis]|uniref:Sugar transferase n=1 Tax=Psychrobacillus lasiicapitis TaxID=1636719 RepID=A0A544TBL3_9BACI|nr:sugar transferase [Psychrobacillus lasiicapitis]TQR14860.1 sugar transferase [Psychrobacillus lasiicapitis]GGA20513.1 multidrug MFS transporter [Psychrobacillus lasiicapitis]